MTMPESVSASVHLMPPPAAVKRLCFDEENRTLRPNMVLVDRQGMVVFEINELGLKGAARDPSRKLAVVWGDSVVFGIEADPYDNILRRAAACNEQHTVALNVVLLGWHPWHLPASLAQQERGGRRLSRLTQAFRGF